MPSTASSSAPTLASLPDRPCTDLTRSDLTRELQQPLSSIEAIAYYLEMTLPAGHTEAIWYLRQIQRLSKDVSEVLKDPADG